MKETIKLIVMRTWKGKPSRIRMEWIDGQFLCEINNKMALNLASQIYNLQKARGRL